MKRTTIKLHTMTTSRLRQLSAQPERGAISTEMVVITIGLFTLATLIIGAITLWATGKLEGLT